MRTTRPRARAGSRRPPTPLTRALDWAGWALFAALLVYAWPNTLGGQTGYVIVSGHSMEPTYYTGDLLITRKTADVQVGDVIVYDVPQDDLGAGMSVVHRVTGGTLEQGLRTQGDNNPSTDVWHPRAVDVRGTVRVHIPTLGRGLVLLRSPLVLAGLGGLSVLWLLWPSRREPLEGAADGCPAPASGAGPGPADPEPPVDGPAT